MKKFLALILALTMVFALCACGEKAPAPAESTAPADEAQPAEAEADPADDFYLDIKFSNVFNPKEWNYKASEMLAEMIT